MVTQLGPLQYVTISDFSPGIWNRFNPIPAPVGAAQLTGTFGCIAQPGGGLGPLPRASSAINLPVPDAAPRNSYYYVNGLKAVYLGDRYEVHVGLTWIDAASNAVRFRWYRWDGATFIQVVDQTGAVQPDPWIPEAVTFAVTRLTSATAPANISIVASWANRTGNGNVWYFPDPAAPATDTPVTDNTQRGQLFAHQGRILNFVPQFASHGSTYSSEMNELINFTDPPQSTTLGTQATMLSPESPYGYGAWGSVSAGELVLVKIAGGGLISYEDIIYPRVVRLPALQGTGPVCQAGSFCSIGMLYYSHNNGVYAWNGNNTAEKISHQLRGDVFNPNYPSFSGPDGAALPPVAYGDNTYISHTNWRDRVVFPNHLLYDATLQSWWLLEQFPSTNIGDITYWSSIGNTLWGVRSHWAAASPGQMFQYTEQTGQGRSLYNWNSQFIPIGEGTQATIHEVELTALSNIDGATVQITLTSETGSTTTLTFNLGTSIGMAKKHIAQLDTPMNVYGVTVRIVANSGNVAFEGPVIYSVAIGTSLGRTTGSYWR